MNLFTEYTKVENEFLLKVAEMQFSRGFNKKEIKIFENIPQKDFKQIIKNLEVREFNKKEIINNSNIIYVLDGLIAVAYNGEIIQKVSKDEMIGLSRNILNINNNYSLISLNKTKIATFTINNNQTNRSLDTLYKNLTIYLLKELNKYKKV